MEERAPAAHWPVDGAEVKTGEADIEIKSEYDFIVEKAAEESETMPTINVNEFGIVDFINVNECEVLNTIDVNEMQVINMEETVEENQSSRIYQNGEITIQQQYLPKQRNKRSVFTPDQKRALQAAFREESVPDSAQRQELAARTGLDELVIRVWFKNQRALASRRKDKKEENLKALFDDHIAVPPGDTLDESTEAGEVIADASDAPETLWKHPLNRGPVEAPGVACGQCGESFAGQPELQSHIRATHVEGSRPGEDITKLEELGRIVSAMLVVSSGHGVKTVRTCSVCGKQGKKQHLEHHVEANHVTGVVLTCAVCQKTFWTRHALEKHRSGVHQIKIARGDYKQSVGF
jgi:hypothetical protein